MDRPQSQYSHESQHPCLIIDVPFDVWSHIASFLSSAHLRTLHTVNHAFFVIAMDERYNNIQIPSNGEEERISRTLSRLMYPPRAQRVHTLQLRPDSMAEYLIQQPILVLSHIPRCSSPQITEPRTLIDRAELLVQTIGGMRKVKKLTMFTTMKPTSPRMRAFEFCMRIIMACGWTTFGSTLRSLTLSMSYEGYVCALTPTPVFPVLEELSIHVAWSPNRPVTDCTNLMRNLLIPFLNNHHSTLQSLKLGFASFSPLTNISSHLLGIHHLPRLRKLDIFDVCSKSDDSGLRHILEIHSDNLLELHLNFGLDTQTSRTEWYARAIFQVALPHLDSLKLGAGCFLDLGLTAAYVQRLGGPLTTVVLDPDRLSYCEAKILMDAFSGRATLEKLYLSVTNLSPELLDLLAARLPSLTFLKLYFKGVCISESQPEQGNKDHLFCQCMRDRVYSDWKLRHFIGSFKGNGRKEDILLEWEAAVGIALPQLHTLRIEK